MIRKINKSDFKYKSKLAYNPEEVNVRLQHFRVFELIELIDKETLEILEDNDIYGTEQYRQLSIFDDFDEVDIYTEDDLQRKPGIWNNTQKSRFIESLMIRLPIPMFYLDGTSKPWRVIDGLQRLHSIMQFIKDSYKLSSLEYLEECNGLKFSDHNFPGYLRKRIMDAELVSYVINPGTPADVKYNIFQRINTGGLQLRGQEIRNAIFKGEPADLTKELAALSSFKRATNNKVTSRRMNDREYANRFIAFQVFHYEDYNGKMDLFLSEALMEIYNRTHLEKQQIIDVFDNSMERCYQLLGTNCFYRPKTDGTWGKVPNKALYDTLSWNISELTDQEFEKLKQNKEVFSGNLNSFLNTDDMFATINDTTGSKKSVINRFSLLKKFIKSYLI